MGHEIGFDFAGYGGWHVFLGLLPEKWQAKHIARRLLARTYKGLDPRGTVFLIHMPRGTWRVVDHRGNVVPHVRGQIGWF